MSRSVSRLGLALAVPALATGCAAAGTPLADAAALPAATTIRVGLADFAVRLPALRAVPGRVLLDVTNAGSTAHDLLATQDGETLGHTRTLPPGGTAALILTVRPGRTIQLVCTLPGHERAGMHNRLEVAA